MPPRRPAHSSLPLPLRCRSSPIQQYQKQQQQQQQIKQQQLDRHQQQQQFDQQQIEQFATKISTLILSHSPTADPKSLSLALSSTFFKQYSSSFSWLPLPTQLINRILKLLWNDAPRALLFFNSLKHLHNTSSPSSSSFLFCPSTLDLITDLAARLRDYRAVDRLLSINWFPNQHPTPRTVSILIERFILSGKPDRAVKLFLSMKQNHNCPQTLESFNTLLDLLCKSRRVEKASSLFKALRNRFLPDVVTYNILADGWCRRKRTPKALELLKEMVESGVDPNVNTFNIMLNGFFKSGQVDDGLRFFKQLKKRGRKDSSCKPDVVSFTTAIHGLGMAGRIDNAREVFDEMIAEGCLPSVATYNAMIQVLCCKDSVLNAINLFNEMVGKGYTPNSVSYNLVIRGLCHVGEMDKAIEFMEKMKLEGCQPNVQTYNILIRYFMEEGEIEKGLELFETMWDQGRCVPNLDTYNVIISAMFSRKRSDDMVVAGRMVMEMVERGHFPRRFMFNRVLNGLLVTGNQDFAKKLLRLKDQNLRLARQMRL